MTPEEQIGHALTHHDAAALARDLVAQGKIDAQTALAATERVYRNEGITRLLTPASPPVRVGRGGVAIATSLN